MGQRHDARTGSPWSMAAGAAWPRDHTKTCGGSDGRLGVGGRAVGRPRDAAPAERVRRGVGGRVCRPGLGSDPHGQDPGSAGITENVPALVRLDGAWLNEGEFVGNTGTRYLDELQNSGG